MIEKTDDTEKIEVSSVYDRKTIKLWNVSLVRLRKLKAQTGIDIVRLVDQGSRLLEKKYQKLHNDE